MQTIKLQRKGGNAPEVVNTEKFYYALKNSNVVDDLIIVGDIQYRLSTVTVETAGGSDTPQTVIIPQSSAEAKTWFSNPKLVIPSPGVGKYIRVTDAEGKYNFGTTPYTGGFGPYLKYVGADPAAQICAFNNSFFFQAPNSRICTGISNITNPLLIVENAGVELYSQISNPANGDGTFIFIIKYLIKDIF